MFTKVRSLAALLALAVPVSLVSAGCDTSGPGRAGEERWATTENTNVKIDWDKVNEAYKAANGPEDLEKRINEIYEGDEVISIAVLDEDAKTQVVTGFFDKNTNGTVEEPEKIFTIKRDPEGDKAQYQTAGYGPYYGYHSPFISIVSGMVVGSMLSSMFMPGYVPMYARRLHDARDARVGAPPDAVELSRREPRQVPAQPERPHVQPPREHEPTDVAPERSHGAVAVGSGWRARVARCAPCG